MNRASLFRRLAKYQPGVIDPKENRLTEAFASVLENAPSVIPSLMVNWLGLSTNAHVAIRTQVPTVSGGFVDLEIRCSDDDGNSLIVWVENKFGAGLHGDQLAAYIRDISASGSAEQRVLLLAPRESMPDGVPETVHKATWQDTAQVIKRIARSPSVPEAERWVLSQFHQYLEEETLTNEDGLDSTQALPLERQAATLRTVDRLREMVDARLSPELGEPIQKNSQRTLTIWRNYRCPTPAGEGEYFWNDQAVLEWTLRLDSDFVSPGLPEPRDAYAFCAGVTFNPGVLPRSGAPAEWIQEISGDGFHFLGDRLWRGFPLLYPTQLLAEPSIEGQADHLASWILSAFHDIERHPLPK